MLAVPLHGADVAPRFCSADEFMIAELDRSQVGHVRRITIPDEAWSRRLERLSAAGVTVLLCGGFNRSFLPLAEGLGIRVISGLAGEAERLIDAFVRGEIEQYRFLPCRGRRRGRRGAGWERRGDDGELRRLRGGKEESHVGIRQDAPAGKRTANGTRDGPLRLARRRNDRNSRSVRGGAHGAVRRRFGGGRGRGFGSGGWGRGGRFGFGMGSRAFDDAARGDVTPRQRQSFLRRRIGELKAELDRMSELLSESSEGGTAGQE
jgi:predicted Fe-Mo cluster-binding NifX family protein